MGSIESLLSEDGVPDLQVPAPEIDPLTEEDALYEAQVLDMRCDALRSIAAVLIDLRTTLQLRDGNTGVLLVYGVGQVAWEAEPRSTPRTAWTIVGSVPQRDQDAFELVVSTMPNARLGLSGARATFVVGDVPGLPPVVPDYGADEATILAGTAHWASPFTPVRASSLGTDS